MPHHPLSVQLIEETIYGPGRLEPFGPPLGLARDEPCPTAPPTPPVTAEPPTPAATMPPHGYALCPSWGCDDSMHDPPARLEVRTVTVPVTLHAHLAGSLLDVLA
ncbi:MAG: hypothetical protein AAF800_02375 [Planctomycetota bacterium]